MTIILIDGVLKDCRLPTLLTIVKTSKHKID